MATVLHILDEQGHFEQLDSDALHLYAHIDPKRDKHKLIELTEEQEAGLNKLEGVIRYLNGEFKVEPYQEDLQAVIFTEKSAKLTEINNKAQDFVNQLAKLDETPQFERDTWLEQAAEAKAWAEDNTAETPILTLIAQMRGVPLGALRQKAYEKAIAYQQLAAIVAGQRQAFEDRLDAAETLEQIRAIEPVYSLPTGANNE